MLKSIALLLLCALKTLAASQDISPSDNLSLTAQNCFETGCKTIFGTVSSKIDTQKHEMLIGQKITVLYEKCNVSFWIGKTKESTDVFDRKYITFFANVQKGAVIQCDSNTFHYPRIALMDDTNNFGVSLYEFKNSFTPMGNLTVGIMFLPNNNRPEPLIK